MTYQEFNQAVNNEFTRCAKYEPNVKISVEECGLLSEYFTDIIWNFMIKNGTEAFYLEYLGATIHEATEHCVTLNCEVNFDIGLEKAFVFEYWYENGVEYVFDIKEF